MFSLVVHYLPSFELYKPLLRNPHTLCLPDAEHIFTSKNQPQAKEHIV